MFLQALSPWIKNLTGRTMKYSSKERPSTAYLWSKQVCSSRTGADNSTSSGPQTSGFMRIQQISANTIQVQCTQTNKLRTVISEWDEANIRHQLYSFFRETMQFSSASFLFMVFQSRSLLTTCTPTWRSPTDLPPRPPTDLPQRNRPLTDRR